jgi:hypothetical protein
MLPIHMARLQRAPDGNFIIIRSGGFDLYLSQDDWQRVTDALFPEPTTGGLSRWDVGRHEDLKLGGDGFGAWQIINPREIPET